MWFIDPIGIMFSCVNARRCDKLIVVKVQSFKFASLRNLAVNLCFMSIGVATDQTISAANELTLYIPMFTANSVRPLVNFTYNLTVNSISIFGSFIFTTTTPAVSHSTHFHSFCFELHQDNFVT